jgi:hypothetical protein
VDKKYVADSVFAANDRFFAFVVDYSCDVKLMVDLAIGAGFFESVGFAVSWAEVTAILI